ncbi:MAG: family 10 glycosylhydrolase [Muribaculaceae bacterium]|nr:family 10 glycosylhydrolase [Muribaculaceae bacterium]
MTKKITILILMLALVLPALKAEEQKREMRAAWLATVSNIDWPSERGTGAAVIARQKQSLIEYLDGFANTNMNAVCIQVRSMCDAMYQSSYEPWSSYLTGSRGTNPGWDPLAFAVEECHKRGIECHAWVNPYRYANGGPNTWNTAQDQALRESGILLTYTNGSGTTTTVLNPGLPESRERIVNVCREMIENYDIDGIIFDDYFYPSGIPTNSTAADYQLWRNSGTTLSFANWRRAQVNQMVADVYNMVQMTKPQVRFAIGPAGVAGTASTSASQHGVTPCPTGSDWQYSSLFSDPLAWLEEGTIDYISPQLYWKRNHSTNPFGPLTQWWSYIAKHFGRHHYASQNIYFMDNDGNTQTSWEEIVAQVQLSRQYTENNAPGVNFYSSRYINGPRMTGLGNYLVSTIFPKKALPPALEWKPKDNLDTPENLSIDGTSLTWDFVDGELVKYAVYAIPTSVDVSTITSEQFEGIKSDYLVAVTYNTSVTLADEYATGYWFAVSSVDGYNFEYTPAYLNCPAGEAEQVTLISPVGDAQAQWSQEFSWSAVEGATFKIEVASDENFNNVLITERGLSENHITLDLNALASATRYYWRVTTVETGKFDKQSEVASFMTLQRDLAPQPTLLYPENGAEIDDNFKFLITDVGADTYKLEIARDEAFTNIVKTANYLQSENGNLSYQCVISLLGTGTYYWHVSTTKADCDPNVSETRSFTITNITTGSTETGYVQMVDVDNDTYAPTDGVSITNNWIRSVKNNYNNFEQENYGSFNRSFTVLGDFLYLTGRSVNSSNADCYLRVYSARTGEWQRDIELPAEVQGDYFPCNNVLVDDAGNLLISNMLLKINNTPLVIYSVNPTNGEVTLRATLSTSEATGRIDHIDVRGDVAAGNFEVFAALSRNNQIIRWTFQNGTLTDTKVTTVAAFYPSSAANFGTSPRIKALGSDIVIVHGSNIQPTKYNVETGAVVDSFDGNSALMKQGSNSDGIDAFELCGKHFLVYSSGDYQTADGHNYRLAMNAEGEDFAGMNVLWTLPKNGIGVVNSTTMSTPCLAVPGDKSNETLIYMYVPGNGIAKYTVTVAAAVPGDVNGDGFVTAADVTALYDFMLNNDTSHLVNGDQNGDGDITSADITAVYDILLTSK